MARSKKMKKETPLEADQNPAASPVLAKVADQSSIFDTIGELVVDVFETHEHFVIFAAVAGVKIEDLDISVEPYMMVIKGERKNPHQDPEKKYFYQECYFGPFYRTVVLPENIDTQASSAEMDKGMLTVKIPKKDVKSS